jgi:D-glycero-D-manno-heptose 1,7-bisphosphate phosphatase
MAELRPAVFLDRDGTVNRPARPGEYVLDPSGVELFAGASEAIALLAEAGFARVVVSNQRCVALGLLDLDGLKAVDGALRARLAADGASLDASYYCTHDVGACTCRKPEPGLLLRAADELALDLDRSWLIGDAESDVEAARRAGCRPIRVEARDGALLDAVRQIIEREES